ncbi:hypothetical protein KSP39_PZI000308 [Platanthera zijinensis]|uniref:Uncharacterized protein n=1 Tax=Platanthera zijinensis TaxID=2320716 RepID=A0AAP0C0L0_9ASPA
MFAKLTSKPLSQELLDRLAGAQAKTNSKTTRYAPWLASKRPADSPYRPRRAKTIRQNLPADESASPTPTPRRENLVIPPEEPPMERDVGVPLENAEASRHSGGNEQLVQETAPQVAQAEPPLDLASPFETTSLVSPTPKTPAAEKPHDPASGSRPSTEKETDTSQPAEIPLAGQTPLCPGLVKSRQIFSERPFEGRPGPSSQRLGEGTVPATGYRGVPAAGQDVDEEFSPPPSQRACRFPWRPRGRRDKRRIGWWRS